MPSAIKLENMERIPNTRLRFLENRPSVGKRRMALFLCDCGKKIEKDLNWVRFLNITSCGCYRSETMVKKNTKHSQASRENKSGAYRSWQAMHQRVKADPRYKDRDVCEQWSGSDGFTNFYEDMGDRPDGLTLERKDNNLGYFPENCVWATRAEQSVNTTAAKRVEINGKVNTIQGWCRELGISYSSVKERRKKGMGIIEALTKGKSS